MTEGVDREVRIDEPGNAVKALVEFMYTGRDNVYGGRSRCRLERYTQPLPSRRHSFSDLVWAFWKALVWKAFLCQPLRVTAQAIAANAPSKSQ